MGIYGWFSCLLITVRYEATSKLYIQHPHVRALKLIVTQPLYAGYVKYIEKKRNG